MRKTASRKGIKTSRAGAVRAKGGAAASAPRTALKARAWRSKASAAADTALAQGSPPAAGATAAARSGPTPPADHASAAGSASARGAAVPAGGAPPPGLCIVGIGASAGGFEAIKQLLSLIPDAASLAFVVVQHLGATQKSLSAELFARRSQMPVVEAHDGDRVQSGHVYTVPGGHEVTIQGGVLHLKEFGPGHGVRHPIDHFFHSLGEDQLQRAIGIILSGSGSDGALGLRTIVANGGIVLVQRPDTAQFDGMPQSALATGVVTHELAVEEMPNVMVAYTRHPYVASPEVPGPNPEDQEALVDAIVEQVRLNRGYDFSGYKRTTLLRRIHRRMGLNHIARMPEYVAQLKRTPNEVDALFKDLLISATEFFRDPKSWEALESQAIAPLIAAKADSEPIRVWVAGASTGEEAYTVAMIILEQLEKAGKHCPVQIFATDANEDALAVARAGIYPAGISDRVSDSRRQRFFLDVDNGRHLQVSGGLRSQVIFGQQNLFSDPPFSGVDLVTCRNVLIYLDAEVQKRVTLLLHFALKPGGFLFLGGSETPATREDLFRAVSKPHRIYQRVGATPRELGLRTVRAGLPPEAAGFRQRLAVPQLTQAARVAQQLILERFAPAAVLVDRNLQVLYYAGPTERYLTQPRGAPTQDLLPLLRENLRSRLRGAMSEAIRNNVTVVVDDASVRRDNRYQAIKLTVAPAMRGEGRLFLVVFQEHSATPAAGVKSESVLVRQLEDELRVTRADLHATVESLESSNEELRASNEQIVSINEELQSGNEELQSSKEELQSVNEELNTVNQQLQAKLGELEAANSDLKNVLGSTDVATVCLDGDLRIRWFSPAARDVLRLIPSDAGRPVSMFATPLLGESVIAAAREVLARHEVKQAEMGSERGRWYLRAVVPYRVESGKVDGVIVNYTDITESKRSLEERAKQLQGFAFELTRAEESERQAIARDLHDDLGQLMTVVKLKLAKLQVGGEGDAQRIVTEVGALITRAERGIRSLAAQLSPPVLYELGLVPALDWLCEEMKNSYDLAVEVVDDGADKPLGQSARSILFRAIRELLINVAKHAGVLQARISTRRVDGRLIAVVRDNGVGLKPDQAAQGKGFGLRSVRERLSYIQGDLQIASPPAGGTEVTLTVPLEEREVPIGQAPPPQ